MGTLGFDGLAVDPTRRLAQSPRTDPVAAHGLPAPPAPSDDQSAPARGARRHIVPSHAPG